MPDARFQGIRPHPKHNLTEEELEKITSLISSRGRIEAIGAYISLANCGLSEAQEQINMLAAAFYARNLELAMKPDKRQGVFRRFMGRFGK